MIVGRLTVVVIVMGRAMVFGVLGNGMSDRRVVFTRAMRNAAQHRVGGEKKARQ
jgi:hypothetical protein